MSSFIKNFFAHDINSKLSNSQIDTMLDLRVRPSETKMQNFVLTKLQSFYQRRKSHAAARRSSLDPLLKYQFVTTQRKYLDSARFTGLKVILDDSMVSTVVAAR